MPRLSGVSRDQAPENVRRYYDELFGDRDPVTEPGTATGTPGDWWTVFAHVPYVFDHATAHFRMFGILSDTVISKLDPKVRELGILRAGYARGSQFVFSQHCKAARETGITDEQIAALPGWATSSAFSADERALLAYTDALILEGGRVSDSTFAALREVLSEADVVEFSYHVLLYGLHATMCKALHLEYDDVPERVAEIPVPTT